MGHNDGLSQPITIRFRASVVLNLDVKVERPFTAIDLQTVLVGTNVLPVDLLRCPSIVLLS